jgi:hypothetical protein
MLTKRAGEFEAKCDVCGSSETVHAHTHAEAWEVIKRRAWAVRRRGFPVVHVCPECPVEVETKKAPSR